MAQFKRFYNAINLGYYFSSGSEDACVYLMNSAPSTTAGQLSDITTIDLTYFKTLSSGDPMFKYSSTISSGLMTIKSGNGSPFVEGPVTFKADGGSVGPFRYIVIGYGTSFSDPTNVLMYYFDYGYSITLTNGQEITFTFPSNIINTVQ
jgi:hypothetical protein